MADHKNHTNHQSGKDPQLGAKAAANLIRERINNLHGQHENDAQKRSPQQMTLIEKFWHEHQDHPDKEAAWNQYYTQLTDNEKHQLWQESQPQYQASPTEIQTGVIEETAKISDSKTSRVKNKVKEKSKSAKEYGSANRTRLAPLMTALLVVVFILILNYNEVVVAQVKQYVTPGTGQNSPTIIDPNSDVAIGNEPRLIIPKINVDVPVVYDVTTYDEAAIQAGLERGVVHYGNTPVPGQAGNNVIVGHSSNNFFNGGKYKFAFVLLEKLEIGDTFILNYEGKRYIYRVFNKVIVEPTDFSIIQPTPKPSTTLITCTPPGTSWQRLAIQAEQISPSPSEAQTAATPAPIKTDEVEIVPGNSQSFFDRLTNSLFN
jgi:sortase A